MRKEIFYAIFAGGALGLVIAFGVWRTNSTLKTTSPTPAPTNTKASTTPTNTPPKNLELTIAKPSEGDLFTVSTVTISGITKAGSLITISAENDDYNLQAENDGGFAQDISLTPGTNQIVITAFNEIGEMVVKNLTVVYSKEFASK